MTPTALKLKGALATYLHDRIAQDAAPVNYNALVKGVGRDNFGLNRSRIAARVRQATRGKLAQDADTDDLSDLLDMFEELLASEEGEDRRRARDEEENPNLETPEHMEEPDLEGEDEEEFSGGSYGSRKPSRFNNEVGEGSPADEPVADRKRRAADRRRMIVDRLTKHVRRARDEDLDNEMRRGEHDKETYDRVRRARDNDNEMTNMADPEEVSEGEDGGKRRYSMDSAIKGFFQRFPSAARIDVSDDGVVGTQQSEYEKLYQEPVKQAPLPLHLRIGQDAKPSGKSFTDRFPGASRIKTEK